MNVNFYGRDFGIAPDVLIPRPETEMMVDAVLSLMGKAYLPGVRPTRAQLEQRCAILDVGTGSGCVAISLALELPEARVSACDISEQALAVARENATRLGANVKFWQSDLMEGVDGDFDLVVANLPYVDENWEWVDKEALASEPNIALYAEDGGLAVIKRLIDQAAMRGVNFLVLEADPCQHEAVIEYAKDKGYLETNRHGFALSFKKAPLD